MGESRIARFHILELFLIAELVALLLFSSSPMVLSQNGVDGKPQVDKFVTPTSVESGDPVTVSITVAGCSGRVDNPIPFDGILLIDMSNSMDDDYPQSDPNDLRLDAVISLVNAVDDETRLAIVTFSTDADGIQGLTTDKELLESKIDGLRGQATGGTNMYEAMQIAQERLMDDGYSDRQWFIILITDGDDTSEAIDTDFFELAEHAANNNIKYYTIGLGPLASNGLLLSIATLSGGQWYPAANAAALEGLYDEIDNEASHMAYTREIWLTETLNPMLTVVSGSVETSPDIDLSEDDLDLFYDEGIINVYMDELRSGEGRFIQFDVVADLLTADSEEERILVDVDALWPASQVTYIWGAPPSGYVEVPQAQFELTRPGALRVRKEFDSINLLLSITLESRYPLDYEDGPIRNITVIERPSHNFQPIFHSAYPPLDLTFPGWYTDTIVWLIPKLNPGQSKVLTVNLEPLVTRPYYHPPIAVNAQKGTGGNPGDVYYTLPNGTSKHIKMPWISTSLVEVDLEGRDDWHVETEYTYGEWISPPQIFLNQLKDVLFMHESRHIWVDSSEANGFWDFTNVDVGDFILGASLYQHSEDSPVGALTVQGQGDRFCVRFENKIMINALTRNGAELYILNQASNNWDLLAISDLPSIEIYADNLIVFDIPPDTVQPDHISKYKLSGKEAVHLIEAIDPDLARRIRQKTPYWFEYQHRQYLPEAFLELLPGHYWWDIWHLFPSLQEEFEDLYDQYGDVMSWGQSSFKIKVVLKPGSLEKHINNNYSTEIILTGPRMAVLDFGMVVLDFGMVVLDFD